MKLVAAILILIFSHSLWAGCEVNGPHTIYANASYEWNTSFSYLPQGRDFLENPRIKVSGCRAESAQRKLLMIGFGVDYFGLSADTASVAYNGTLHPDTCHLTEDPFENSFTSSMRKDLYAKRTDFINKCARVIVKHAGERNLKNIANPECLIEQVDGNTSHIKGGYCYFRIYPDSFFEVTTIIDDQCTDAKVLSDLDIDPMEVFSHINFFIAGDATGLSQDLTPLKSIGVRYNLEPENSLVQVSKSYFDLMPRWPNQWVLPDVHMGRIQLKQVGDNFSVRPELLIDNRCQKRCRNSLCSSPCNYATSVSGQYRLFELKGGRSVEIASWYDGGIVPPLWQGVLPGSYHNLGEWTFEIGGRYQLLFEINDPKEDFIFLSKESDAQLMGLTGLKLSEISLEHGMPEIKTDWAIDTIKPMRTIATLSHTNGLYILRDLDLGFSDLREFYYWPPYYQAICDSSLTSCLPPMGRKYLTLSTTFSVESKNGRVYQLGNFVISRDSLLSKSYRKRVNSLPEISCKSL